MTSLRSILGLTLSLLAHGSVGAYLLTQNNIEKPPQPKKIAMQMAMFKTTPPPLAVVTPAQKPINVEPKPVVEPIKAKAPVTKPNIKPKPPKKVKSKVKKKLKKTTVIKKIIKKKPVIKPRKKVPPKPKAVVRKRPSPVQKKPTPKRAVRKATPRKLAPVQQHKRPTPQQRPVHRAKPPTHTKRIVKKAAPQRKAPIQQHRNPRRAAPAARAKPVSRPSNPPRATVNPHLERQYQNSIRQKIEQKKVYPRRAKRMRKQGVVKVAFTISRNGSISKLRIMQSSGIKSLDQAALAAVKKVGRFPAIPAGIHKTTLSYVIPIAYRLR